MAAEFAKQLPVKEAMEPGAKEVGSLGADLIKCLRLALFPLRWGAEQFDRYDRFVRNNAEAVPFPRRIEPAAQIVGPILEGIRYEPEGSMTDEAFGQLLRRAFDSERSGQAHPAFPSIIRALADDEMVILRGLQSECVEVTYAFARTSEDVWDADASSFKAGFPDVFFFEQYRAFLNHIEALGLIRPLIGNHGAYIPDGFYPQKYPLYFEIRLSQLGRLFTAACLTPMESP